MSGFTDKSELVENEGEVSPEGVDEPGEDEMRNHAIDTGNNNTVREDSFPQTTGAGL